MQLERNKFCITQKRLKKFESNYKSFALNVLFSPHIGKKIRHT